MAMKRVHNSVRWLSAIGVVGMSIGIAAAQSGSISGMYVFPKRNQPPEQQQQDERRCDSSAIEMTGKAPRWALPVAVWWEGSVGGGKGNNSKPRSNKPRNSNNKRGCKNTNA